MAWRYSQLLLVPVQLVFLASVCCPGVWGSTVSEELHRMVGQSLSVQCQYKPKEESYVLKTWCRQTAPSKCTRVVTTSEPRKAARELQHTIWDDPEAGFFNITMTQLTEDDSAFYWCGPYYPSLREVTVLRNISLVVSPAPSTLPSQTIAPLPESTATIFMPFPVLTTSPEETTDSSINGTGHRDESTWQRRWSFQNYLTSPSPWTRLATSQGMRRRLTGTKAEQAKLPLYRSHQASPRETTARPASQIARAN
ncbi:trem-like transcript 4 protein isoform X3 [Mus musculus]|uniref:Isoform 3 of Trem-like transcript 4 protein n=2 Tax=Mus musculus TaxID=10090 RepID=Q3LRV9-3|nr:trem-like transcript 4 protein isoform X3 [Mus musculus]|eukprot:XP_006524212.1 PREDICTED: trem-like transcript 4 protein isoform X3 [Mus musculus]